MKTRDKTSLLRDQNKEQSVEGKVGKSQPNIKNCVTMRGIQFLGAAGPNSVSPSQKVTAEASWTPYCSCLQGYLAGA